MLITGAEIDGVGPRDVRIVGENIAEIGTRLARRVGERRLDAGGGALLPGLHDHHLHLFALAAEAGSVRCGPPEVCDREALRRALATVRTPDGWIRGTGYHESVAGELDRSRLDALVSSRPVRVQHRSGALWVVNSAGSERLGLDSGADAAGIERAADGRATGRLFRLDAWLRQRLGSREPPNLAAVSRELAAHGVIGVTDATATNDATALALLVGAAERGELLQRVEVMGTSELPAFRHPHLARSALKLMLDERDFPDFEALCGRISAAHADGRGVAIHCVTRAELVLAIAALESAGAGAGDRIEHAGVAPPETLASLRQLGLSVVTQPNFVRERGDAWLADVEARDIPWLYRGRGFVEAGVALGGGTDAPFGRPDPWAAMRAAVDRRTAGGAVVGGDESLTPERALALFTSAPGAPGGPPRQVAAGRPADLCLLDRRWSEARLELSSECVVAAIRAGEML